MKLNIGTRAKLNNGVEMPILGLGTWRLSSGEAREAVLHAFEAGYRLIDTAKLYGNEKDVGQAVKESGLPREEIFITTKLWQEDHGYENALRAFEHSLRALGLGYIDLYLIHWPGGGKRAATWKAMENLLANGKCRAIGVSNYTITHLKELLENCEVVPAVNQVEFHPWLFQRDLLDFCLENDIRLEAYSPLTHGKRLNDPEPVRLGKKYHKSPAQILIRWGLQHKVVEIPKSSKRERIFENADIFDFDIHEEDMLFLDDMHEKLRSSWDPSQVP